MNITASAPELASAVKLAATLADDKGKVPAFAAAHLVTEGGELTITAGNGDAVLSIKIAAQGEGEFAVSAKRLAELTRHFGKTEIVISVTDRTATVMSGKSRFRLPVIPLNDLMPPLALETETGRVELECALARDLFQRPVFAASTEETRFYLNGILLHNCEAGLVGAAADGHRLARIVVPATSSVSSDRGLIIPLLTVKAVIKLLDDVDGMVALRRSERLFELAAANVCLVSKLIDATYPDYERVTAIETEGAITVDRAQLIEAVARFTAISNPRDYTPGVALAWNDNGELHLSSRDGSEDLLVGEACGAGAVTLQTALLAELLDELRGDRVRFTTGADNTPVHIDDPADENFLALIMPLRGWRKQDVAA